MPTSDAKMLLESLKTFKVTKSHPVSGGLLQVSNVRCGRAILPVSLAREYQHLNLKRVD
ncbi:hypothetical protein JG687_00002466 [Phytophthora cactorum]|uniref:Uncharacterized protein n=1 Tax=Phytophthora cactorum TaxID=29920 RepID=A0A8T1UX63_9STRA|nr:hypothetical protein GQ600_11302 [Phytophthora cactorum]KAG6970741.1 hypothetical protein JG687_00002466 [Phytophthora cactorum]